MVWSLGPNHKDYGREDDLPRRTMTRAARATTEELTGVPLHPMPAKPGRKILARRPRPVVDGVVHCQRCGEPVTPGGQCRACRQRRRARGLPG